MSELHMVTRAADEFQAHLERCARCREHPFALCWVGLALLKNVNLAAGIYLAPAPEAP